MALNPQNMIDQGRPILSVEKTTGEYPLFDYQEAYQKLSTRLFNQR